MSGEDNMPLDIPPPVEDASDLHDESIYAMWHDPSTYDHLKHGPPYLPERKIKMASTSDTHVVRMTARRLVQKTAADEMTEIKALLEQVQADFDSTPMSELAGLLAFIQAEAAVHQAHHWQTRGDYGDHLLFDRIYSGVYGNIDKVAEKMIGTGHHSLAHPILLAKHCSMVVQSFYRDVGPNPSSDLYPGLSLRAVLRTLVALKVVYNTLEQKGQLSNGIDNLLQGIADEHEGYVYLLKQRTQSRTASYDRRVAWDEAAMEHATPEAREKYLKKHPNADKSKHTVKKDVKYVPKRHPQEVADEVNKMSPQEVDSEVKSLPAEHKDRFDKVLKQISTGDPTDRDRQLALGQVKSEMNYEKVGTERQPKHALDLRWKTK